MGLVFLSCIWAFWAAAQEQTSPRLTPQQEAAEATIIVNEINTDDYPEVLILATVLRAGGPVTGLNDADFRVREDEVDQQPLTVEPQLPPLSVVLTIDASGSMRPRMAETQQAARQFVETLDEHDSVQIVSFAREIETLTSMTTTKSTVVDAIEGISARGDTALYDGILRSVDLVAERRGRKAIVVLSDGVDDDGTGQPLSEHTIDGVLERASEVNVPIFVIGLGTEMDEAVLRDIAASTGAQYLNAPDANELNAVYAQISDQLSGQYAIRYSSNLPADGIERRVDLAALDAQGSKTYTPEGSAPSQPRTDNGGCPIVDTLDRVTPELEQAKQRYQERLISVIDRNAARDEAIMRIVDAIGEASPNLACIGASLAAASELYARDLIPVTARNELREALVQPLSAICEARNDEAGHIECLTFYRDAYRDDIIPVTTRNNLRADTFGLLLDHYSGSMKSDEALAQVGKLYNDDLIPVTDRNTARQRLLDADR